MKTETQIPFKIVGIAGLMTVLCALLSPLPVTAEGTWIPLQNQPPEGIGTMLLMPDGTVMAQGTLNQPSKTWYRLTPSNTGGYTNGVWTSRASMSFSRLYYSSDVLRDGRVFFAGAEYGNGTTNSEMYNSFNDSWTEIPVPPGLITINNTVLPNGQNTAGFSDSSSVILPSGEVLIAPVYPAVGVGTVIYNPFTDSWRSNSVFGNQNEAGWVKLPDDSILSIDTASTSSERFIPSLNKWVNDTNVPVALYDPYGSELGAALLLPNGKAFYIGSTPLTALYTPSGTTNP